MSNKPWYHEGLRFRCKVCGSCCTGAPGYVWVDRAEIATLAAAVGLTPEEFEASFVRRVLKRKSLIELPNGDCVFFDNLTRRCKVYEHRPRQCRSWPFWKSNLRTPEAWEQTCLVCAGSGRGPLVSLEQIQGRLMMRKV